MFRKYDTVFSYVSEDAKAARKLGRLLDKEGITYYDYQKAGEKNIGRYLDDITNHIYKRKGYCVVVFCSKDYINEARKFVTQELNIIRAIHPRDERYLFLLNLDNTFLNLTPDKESREVIYTKLDKEESYKITAEAIRQRVSDQKRAERKYGIQVLLWGMAFLLTTYFACTISLKKAEIAWKQSIQKQYSVATAHANIPMTEVLPKLTLYSFGKRIEINNATVQAGKVVFTPPYPMTPNDTLRLTLSYGGVTHHFINNSYNNTFTQDNGQ